jgi:hypothetical protein
MLSFLVALTLQSWPVTNEPCSDVDGGVPLVRVAVGTQKIVQVPGLTTARALHPQRVTLQKLAADQLLIIGAELGLTVVLAESADAGVTRLPVQVRFGGPLCRISEIARAFPCGSTLHERDSGDAGDAVVLDGVASSAEEWIAAHRAVEKFPSLVVVGTLDPQVIADEFAIADAALKAAGFARVHWLRDGEYVRLTGELHDDEDPKLRALERLLGARLELLVRQPKRKAAK